MKILGTIINNKLTWDDNCKMLISKVNKRMLLLKKMLSFGATIEEIVHFWKIYCRSQIEQSSQLWSSSLSQENIDDLERTQKAFAKLVLRNRYNNDVNSYEHALLILNLETLEKRRQDLSLNLAKNSIKNETMTNFFPEKEKSHLMNLRNTEKYEVFRANTDRMRESSEI